MHSPPAFTAWLTRPLRVDECSNLVGAAALATVGPGVILGLVAAAHELATGATGYSLGEIVFAYFAYTGTWAITFGVVLGIPYVLAWDRFIGGPRWLFVAGATGFGALVGAIVYGWWWVFALGGLLMSAVFVACLRLPEEPPPTTPKDPRHS
jgi:hypothetical protein